eukprot:1138363-Pelagomonas_calceolata.AAC.1
MQGCHLCHCESKQLHTTLWQMIRESLPPLSGGCGGRTHCRKERSPSLPFFLRRSIKQCPLSNRITIISNTVHNIPGREYLSGRSSSELLHPAGT